MASLENYLTAFVKVIPQRTKTLKYLYRNKKDCEVMILHSKGIKEKYIHELKRTIGENTFFRKAEKRDQQSIRHYLWKISKSFKFFLKIEPILRKKIEEDPEYASQVLRMLSEYKKEVPTLIETEESLHKIYKKQVAALTENKMDDYFSLVKKEEEMRNFLTRYVKNVKKRQGTLMNFLNYLDKHLEKDSNYLVFLLCAFSLMMFNMLIGAYIAGAVPSQFESAGGGLISELLQSPMANLVIINIIPIFISFDISKSTIGRAIRDFIKNTI